MINIRISPKAFMKMQALVAGFDKEVGWFSTCERVDDGFRIKDVLVFPQYTTGAYIDDEADDPLEFRKWLDTLSDDEYNSRRCWGHSHVNMAVVPSGTDTSMFKRFKESNEQALDNRFTICVILNKKFDMTWWVYDSDNKKEYNNSNINVILEIEDGMTNVEWFTNIKPLVKDIYHSTNFVFGGATLSKNNLSLYGKKKTEKKDTKNTTESKKKAEKKEVSKNSKTPTYSKDIYDIYIDNKTDYDDYYGYYDYGNNIIGQDYIISLNKENDNYVLSLTNKTGECELPYLYDLYQDKYYFDIDKKLSMNDMKNIIGNTIIYKLICEINVENRATDTLNIEDTDGKSIGYVAEDIPSLLMKECKATYYSKVENVSMMTCIIEEPKTLTHKEDK